MKEKWSFRKFDFPSFMLGMLSLGIIISVISIIK